MGAFREAEVGPARATVITYVNPAVAITLGVAVLGEPLTPVIIVASFMLILAGSLFATVRLTPDAGRGGRAARGTGTGRAGGVLGFSLGASALLQRRHLSRAPFLVRATTGGDAGPARRALPIGAVVGNGTTEAISSCSAGVSPGPERERRLRVDDSWGTAAPGPDCYSSVSSSVGAPGALALTDSIPFSADRLLS